jgi:hypothetical protein
MNDSDMEVDEELPNLSVNIEREKFEKLTKKEVKLQEVINELIHTEQKHVRNLKIMKHHFYIPIKVEYLLSEDERNLLFPNLDEILDLHSLFNNRLKKLRRENPIVSIEQLITILQDQFQNENGTRFQSACAAFCQNQSEAMKFLQTKSKLLADKFTLFLAKSENDSICRKLHLKDFLPTEVQRLVKYRLLFQEMSKNTRDDDQETKKRLSDCIEASTKISLYVNKAVTECENKKRVIEIQNKLDTKEFDQYCNKSHVLMPYRNLQLINRRLVYEGELEWKLSNIKLMALLFEDILVFLETVRHESSNDEKRRYVLRPLIYIIGKTKQMFTPVIPLSCINSFRSMHDKRSFHLVAIIEDSIKLSSNSNAYSSSLITTKQTFQSTKPIQAQMLFILIAKSGDERNKWTSHLQDLTGKMMQSVGNDTHNTNIQDLTTTNNTTKTSTISASNLLNSSNSIIGSKNNANSISSSALISSSTKNKEFLSLDSEKNRTNTMSPTKEEDLNSQLETNTNEILNLLKVRHDLLSKILKLNPSPDSLNIVETNNKVLINNSIGLVGSMTTNLLTESNMNQQAKSIQILIKLEENLKNLNQYMNETPATIPATTTTTTTTTSVKLPDLSRTMNNISNKKPSIIISSNVNSRAAAIMNNNDLNDCIAADAVSTTTTTSELTADLSEDEQINYYDEYDYNSSNDNINDNENDDDDDDDNNSNNEKINNETKNNQSNDMMRRFSDSSNKTLCILAGKSSNKKKSNISEDADDEEDDTAYNSGSIKTTTTTTTSTTGKNINSEIINNDLQQLNDSQNSNITTDIDGVVETEIKKCFRSSNEILKSLAPLEINSLSSSSSSQTKKHSLNDDANDLSDDEVKDYLTLKDNFDEISHV